MARNTPALKNQNKKSSLLLGTTAITGIKSIAIVAAGLIGITANQAHAIDANALPTGGSVESGTGTFDYSKDTSTLNVNQTSDRAVFDWKTFNIGVDAQTNFNQNSSSSIAVNRVSDANPSQILGGLSANGQVLVLNQNGVFFGSNARVDVAGLVVSTGTIDTDAFMNNGTINLSNINTGASVINNGLISVKEGGLAAFVAPNVINNGVINARLGKVALASGNTATVDLFGDGLVELALDDKIEDALIENNGLISANGGTVAMTTAAAKGIVDSVINMNGIIEAKSVGVKNGKIILGGANTQVNISGTIDATGDVGGDITITGESVSALNGSLIDASGTFGGGYIRFGGDFQGGGNTPTADFAFIDTNAILRADALAKGNGGTVIVWSDIATGFFGNISSQGADAGQGGLVETSSKGYLESLGIVTAGEWLLDPRNLTITNSTNFRRSVVDSDGLRTITATGPNNFGNTSFVSDGTIEFALNNGTNVTLKTSSGDNGDGDITVNAQIDKTNGGDATLRLEAHDDIIVSQDIISTSNALNVELIAGALGNQSGDHNVSINNDIITNGGNLLATGHNISQGTNDDVNTGGGDVTYTALEDIFIDDDIRTEGGNATFSAGGEFEVDNSDDEVDTTGENGNGSITVMANLFDLDGTFDAGNAQITLGRNSNGQIDVGDSNGSFFRIDQAELDRMTASTLQIGKQDTGFDNNVRIDNADADAFAQTIINTKTPSNGTDENVNFEGSNSFDALTVNADDNIIFADNAFVNTQGNATFTTDTNTAGVGGFTMGENARLDSNGNNITVNTLGVNLGAGAEVDAEGGNIDFNNTDIFNSTDADSVRTSGTGTVDINQVDGGSLQNAIDAVENTGSGRNTIHASAGTYSSVTLAEDNFTLEGANHGFDGTDETRGTESEIQAASPAVTITGNNAVVDGFLLTGADGDTGIFVNGADNATLTNNVITGQQGSNGPILGDGIFLQNSSNSIVSNNFIHDVGDDGIQGNNADGLTVTGNTVERVGDAGIAVISGSSNVSITGNTVTDADGGFGIRASGTGSVNVSDNTVTNAGDANRDFQNDAIHVDGGYNTGSVSGNTVNGSADNGIELDGVSNITADNNTIDNTTGNGIAVIDGEKITVSNSEITTTGESGINVNNSDDAMILGNNIKDASVDGIQVSESDDIVIDDNDILAMVSFLRSNTPGAERDGIHVVGGENATINNNRITGGVTFLLEGITGALRDGIHVENNLGVDITNNRITGVTGLLGATSLGAGRHGIYVTGSNEAIIQGNDITGVKENGIDVHNSNDITIDDNDIFATVFAFSSHTDGAGNNGINVSGGMDAVINNNRITGNTAILSGAGVGAGNNGIHVENNSGVEITNNKIAGVEGTTLFFRDANGANKNGIFVSGSDNAIIRANDISRTGSNGIHILASENTDVIGNFIGTNGGQNNINGDGILLEGAHGAEIIGNIITETNSLANAFGSGIQSRGSNNIMIKGNTISNVDWDGVRIAGGSDVLVHDNDITNSQRTGIYAGGVTRSTITENDINGTNSHHGIDVQRGTTSNITGNDVRNTAREGILAGRTSGLTIHNNDVVNTGDNGIRVDRSSNAQITYNDIDETDDNGIYVTNSFSADIEYNEINKRFSGANTLDNGIYVENSNYVDVKHNTVDDTLDNGIYVSNSDNAEINSNTVTDANRHGILVNPSDYVDIAYNTVNRVGLDGIHVDGGDYADIYQNNVYNTGGDGIDVNDNDYVEIAGNDIYNTSGAGIEVDDSYDADIRYNDIDETDNDAIYVGNSNYADIYGNEINRNYRGANTLGDGIEVYSSYRADVTGNDVDDTRGNGIYIRSSYAATANYNEVEDADANGIYVSGSDYADIKYNEIDDIDGHGILVNPSDYVDIAYNDIHDIGWDGIHVEYGVGADIYDNHVGRVGDDGIDVYGNAYADIINNYIHNTGRNSRNNDGNGIEVDKSFGADIRRNHIDYAGDDGIEVDDSSYVRIINNDIHYSNDDGIDVDGGFDVRIRRNEIDGAGDDGIRVDDNGRVRITDNDVYNTDDEGIQVTDAYNQYNDDTAVVIRNNDIQYTDHGIGILVDGFSNSIITDNRVRDTGQSGYNTGTGIEVLNGYDTRIRRNIVRRTGHDGIEVVGVDTVNVQNNTIRRTHEDGIFIGDFNQASVINNNIRRTGDDGIEVVDGNFVRIADNDVSRSGFGGNGGDEFGADNIHVRDVGIDLLPFPDVTQSDPTRFDNEPPLIREGEEVNILSPSTGETNISPQPTKTGVEIIDNTVDDAKDDGIETHGSNNILIDSNDVSNANDDGIIITGFGGFPQVESENEQGQIIQNILFNPEFNAEITDNTVNGAGSDGIESTGFDIVDINGNTVDESGENGIFISGPRNGTTVIAGNTLNDNTVGMRFESGAIDLTGDSNVINGGEIGLQFDPFLNQFALEDDEEIVQVENNLLAASFAPIVSDLSLVDDTFGTTEFNNQSDFFIRLENGALFNPGTPTILDALDVSFNGVTPSDTGGIITDPVVFEAIGDQIFDFIDEANRGLIFFGISPSSDINDILPEQNLAALLNNPSALLTILGLPFAGDATGGIPASILNDLAPAAGGELTPEQLNELETAAGSEKVGCWSDAFSSLGSGAPSVSYDLGGDTLSQLGDAVGCGL